MLVQGYMVSRVVEGVTMETLYAVEGGRIFESNEHKYSDSFDGKGRVWSRVYTLPASAEFIGNYPMVKNVAKWA